MPNEHRLGALPRPVVLLSRPLGAYIASIVNTKVEIMPVTLTQKSAFVTGSSRGIGAGIALKLAEHGVKRIAINYVTNEASAQATAKKVQALGAEALLVKADVGKVEDITRMFKEVKAAFGSLGIYVSNARATLQTGFYQNAMEIPVENWEKTFDSQAREFLLAVRESVPLMTGKDCRIIAITYEPGGRTGSWMPWAAMGSAKAAKESLVRYFAVALATKGITVNSISPGACDDSVLSGLPPEVFGQIKQWHESGWTPMRRLGQPADIGNACVLMCSELSSFVTGQLIHVDGGASSMDPVFPLAIQGIT